MCITWSMIICLFVLYDTKYFNIILTLMLLQILSPCDSFGGVKKQKKQLTREFDLTLGATVISAIIAIGCFILAYQGQKLRSKHKVKI